MRLRDSHSLATNTVPGVSTFPALKLSTSEPSYFTSPTGSPASEYLSSLLLGSIKPKAIIIAVTPKDLVSDRILVIAAHALRAGQPNSNSILVGDHYA